MIWVSQPIKIISLIFSQNNRKVWKNGRLSRKITRPPASTTYSHVTQVKVKPTVVCDSTIKNHSSTGAVNYDCQLWIILLFEVVSRHVKWHGLSVCMIIFAFKSMKFPTYYIYYILNKEIQEFLVKIKMLFLSRLEIFISSREINLCRLDTFPSMVANRPVMNNRVSAFGLLWILLCLQLQLYTSHKQAVVAFINCK